MEVTLVKHLSEKTTVEWSDEGSGMCGSFVRDCPDEPSAEFRAALEAVRLDLLNRMAIDSAKLRERFRLTGVSVSLSSAGHRQFKPSGTLEFGWGESGVSLPLLRERVDEEAGTSVLSDVELKHVEVLLDEGASYAVAARNQGELALEHA
jgi:hypothetical protein